MTAHNPDKPITDVHVQLIGEDGNAFAIIGRTCNAMRRAGVSKQIREMYSMEARSGDYDNVLRVTMKYVYVS